MCYDTILYSMLLYVVLIRFPKEPNRTKYQSGTFLCCYQFCAIMLLHVLLNYDCIKALEIGVLFRYYFPQVLESIIFLLNIGSLHHMDNLYVVCLHNSFNFLTFYNTSFH